MKDLIANFEKAIIIKTLMFEVDMDYFSVDNLEEIAMYAEELEIDSKYINYNDIYNSEDSLKVYNKWLKNINNWYLDCKDGLMRC